jgi:hypothetical protein
MGPGANGVRGLLRAGATVTPISCKSSRVEKRDHRADATMVVAGLR